jgi:cation transport regulator ChaC
MHRDLEILIGWEERFYMSSTSHRDLMEQFGVFALVSTALQIANLTFRLTHLSAEPGLAS